MNILLFDATVTQSTVGALLSDLRRPNAPRHVFVDSPGGTFDFFSTLGPAIERQGIVTCAGDVGSAAVILFMLGHTRKVFPFSTFFFHEVRALVGPMGQITIAGMEEVAEYEKEMSGESREVYQDWMQQMRSAQRWFLEFMSQKSGVPTATILKLMRAEATLSAREAIHYGIAHGFASKDFLRR